VIGLIIAIVISFVAGYATALAIAIHRLDRFVKKHPPICPDCHKVVQFPAVVTGTK
jgi:uncharacterized protein YneF (UPF0154 family)